MAKPELSDPVTLRLPVDVLRDIEAIASACERTRSWVIVRALRAYLADEGRDILSAIEGRREIEAGGGHDFDAVLAEIRAIVKGRAA